MKKVKVFLFLLALILTLTLGCTSKERMNLNFGSNMTNYFSNNRAVDVIDNPGLEALTLTDREIGTIEMELQTLLDKKPNRYKVKLGLDGSDALAAEAVFGASVTPEISKRCRSLRLVIWRSKTRVMDGSGEVCLNKLEAKLGWQKKLTK